MENRDIDGVTLLQPVPMNLHTSSSQFSKVVSIANPHHDSH